MQHLDERGDDAPARSRVARQMRGGDRSVTLTLVRHASTAMNSDEAGAERVRAWMDLPLSKAGKEEAESTARELRKVDIDVIFHSDLERASATAKAISRTTGAELVEMRKLRPWDLGEMTGKPVKDVAGDIEKYACELPDRAVPGGESFDTFRQRVFSGLKAIVSYNAAQPAVIVHNNTERLLKGWIAAGMPATWKCDPKTFTDKGLSTSVVGK
ncbi:MAG TPA: histidine phosphatase family protein, partial [Gemmataceae bacterium]|nr:histidine phosphatase family protein [Gemmataceae bacterium]